jgi:hypothetical protein
MYVKLGPVGRKNRAETVVIDDCDTWNLDHSLALIIAPALKQLKEKKQGAPFVHNEDVPKFLRATEEEIKGHWDGGDTDEHYFDRWDYVMDEMIFAFESKLEDWEEQFMSGENDVDFKEIPDKKDNEGEPLFEMVYGPNHTRKSNIEGMKKYSDRINKGFQLFGKYYNGLWD